MSRKLEKWLLVQWNSDGERDIVNVRCLVDSNVDLRTGCPVNLMIKGEKKAGTLIARCNERRLLEQMVGQKRSEGTDIASDEQTKQEPSDFSSSGSSWEPSDNNNSDSDEEEQPKEKIVSDRKKYIIEKSRTKRKTLTPSHRANAVIPKAIQNASSSVKTDNNKKRTLYDVVRETNADKSLSDGQGALPLTELTLQNVTIDFNDIIGMRRCFYDLFKKVKDMRNLKIDSGSNECDKNKSEIECDQDLSNDEKESGGNEESHRFEDASLVNNEYNAHEVNKDKVEIPLASNVGENEWVPIGSGKTLIHKDSFRKVNWKSYTIATRTLLLAAFPRRTLATHSLTGKKSPAFQNKPPKMCLDPKIISDIIIEIIGRFKVKENLVRSIITTKCADECKMYKARLVKKKLALIKEKSATKQEVENKEDTPAQ
ncbi:uncharacterized protein LOC113516189 [Galleria mellonella]|uniref:Uncharacterized protein LOC113516189 n=1 Tax=Galleria mellonella TaxID=7137 RepID=A0A6J1WV98_GALME|nr:uncharacterized protein LOC113516189 [Galleria mellonella]